ncbi:uncharacterized protein [Typha latifolia]|uniref:uncharacterized protein n=1 Tax=Typha latifolia TaxID=4733 RepID=UPI003C2BAD94
MALQEGSMNKLKVGKTKEYRFGTDTELLTIDGEPAKLFLLCGERFEAPQAFRSGAFSVHMINVKAKQIAMVTCMVGDHHHWMLAKDSLVFRVEAQMFAFGLPGFFCGLRLPSGSNSDEKLKMLEEIFTRFCDYRDLAGKEGSELDGDLNQDTNPWTRAAFKAKPDPDGNELNGTGKMQRAIRTSAVVKLLSRSLLSGALDPSKHVQMGLRGCHVGLALPSMWAVADLLDAIETGRAPMGREGLAHGRDGLGSWCVNVEGLMLLLKVMRAAREKMRSVDKKRWREEDPS